MTDSILHQLHPWDLACKLIVERASPSEFSDQPLYKMAPIDPGMNFFVLALEELGCKPKYSCEGHPRGAYISFNGPHLIAFTIHDRAHFEVLGGDGEWVWNAQKYEAKCHPFAESDRVGLLRDAADAWMCRFEDRLPKLRKLLGLTV